MQTKVQIDLIVRSFAYVAQQRSLSPATLAAAAQYEQILTEAEKHRQALRLIQRDVFDMAYQKLRTQALTKLAYDRKRRGVSVAVERALGEISRISAQYSPHKLAA